MRKQKIELKSIQFTTEKNYEILWNIYKARCSIWQKNAGDWSLTALGRWWLYIKRMEHVPNIFMSFDKYLFLEVINILILIGLFKQYDIQLFKKYLNPI